MDYVGKTVKVGAAGLDLSVLKTDWTLPAGTRLTITKEMDEAYNISAWITGGVVEMASREVPPADTTPMKDSLKG